MKLKYTLLSSLHMVLYVPKIVSVQGNSFPFAGIRPQLAELRASELVVLGGTHLPLYNTLHHITN